VKLVKIAGGGSNLTENEKIVPKLAFSIVPPGAGARDALGQIGVAWSVITRTFNATVFILPYRNYHSPEVDFLNLFNVSQVPDVLLSPPPAAEACGDDDLSTPRFNNTEIHGLQPGKSLPNQS
jgi:hypothetical protein